MTIHGHQHVEPFQPFRQEALSSPPPPPSPHSQTLRKCWCLEVVVVVAVNFPGAGQQDFALSSTTRSNKVVAGQRRVVGGNCDCGCPFFFFWSIAVHDWYWFFIRILFRPSRCFVVSLLWLWLLMRLYCCLSPVPGFIINCLAICKWFLIVRLVKPAEISI